MKLITISKVCVKYDSKLLEQLSSTDRDKLTHNINMIEDIVRGVEDK